MNILIFVYVRNFCNVIIPQNPSCSGGDEKKTILCQLFTDCACWSTPCACVCVCVCGGRASVAPINFWVGEVEVFLSLPPSVVPFP